jgi:Domain of unknown function (DUF4232)
MRSWAGTLLFLVLAGSMVAVASCGSSASPAARASSSSAPVPDSPSLSSAPASPTPGGEGAEKCKASQLKITLVRTGAVTGELGGYIRFTNRGAAACRLSGWPTVVAVSPSGKHVAAAQARHGLMFGGWQYAAPLPVLELRRGSSAYAIVAAADHSARGGGGCGSYRLLKVGPPGAAHHVWLSAWLRNDARFLPACTTSTGSTALWVSAVVPLTDLPHAS